MTEEHLPECPMSTKDAICCSLACVCEELRACAKRVLAGASEQDYANGKSHGLLDGYEDGYQEGYADALRKGVLSTYTEIADILENLPLLVRLHRRSRGLSLRQASAQSGVDFSTLTRLEQCENTGLVSVVLVLRWMEFSR